MVEDNTRVAIFMLTYDLIQKQKDDFHLCNVPGRMCNSVE